MNIVVSEAEGGTSGYGNYLPTVLMKDGADEERATCPLYQKESS